MSAVDKPQMLRVVTADDGTSGDVEEAEARISGHGKLLGKLRLDRGPLRWWLLIIGLLTIQFEMWRFAAGTALVITGAALHLASKGHLRPGKRFLKLTQAITTRGPYRFVRNPFYLANLLAETGLLVIIGQVWIAAVYYPIWAWVYRKTILEEEAKLRGLCGAIYLRYCEQVPRLLPVPWKFRPKAELSGPRFSWSNPHISDGNEIQRALRLISYPLLLRAVAAVYQVDRWDALIEQPAVVLSAVGFLLFNAVGALTTPLLQHFRRPVRPDPDDSISGPVSSPGGNARTAA